MADSSQTSAIAGIPSPSTGPGQMLLPAGLVRRAGSPCLWIDITWRGTRIRRSSGTADLAEAVLALARIQTEGPPATGERPVAVPTLRHLLTRIEDEHRAGSLATYSLVLYRQRLQQLAAFMGDELGMAPELRRVTSTVVREFIAWRARTPIARNGRRQGNLHPPSARTLSNDLDHLRACFRRAVACGWMEEEPTRRIQRDSKAHQPRVRAMTIEQVQALLQGARAVAADRWARGRVDLPFLAPLLEVIFGLGLRREEARLLTSGDIDLERGFVTIAPKDLDLTVLLSMRHHRHAEFAKAMKRGCRPALPRLPTDIPDAALAQGRYHDAEEALEVHYRLHWHPKGDCRPRRIPIPAPLRPLLSDLVKRPLAAWYPDDRLVMARRRLSLPPPPLLFPGREGGLLRHSLNSIVGEAARLAGIPHPRIHDLRHTYATHLRRKGVELATIQRLLGHQDLKTTLIYADFSDEEAGRAVKDLTW
ncbi:MAG: tyrosine-type recombinase/integrase [Planctomycetes bacterium]|nr:tyrosine-type recombinase/integrase [Planctomycetota bacterium]